MEGSVSGGKSPCKAWQTRLACRRQGTHLGDALGDERLATGRKADHDDDVASAEHASPVLGGHERHGGLWRRVVRRAGNHPLRLLELGARRVAVERAFPELRPRGLDRTRASARRCELVVRDGPGACDAEPVIIAEAAFHARGNVNRTGERVRFLRECRRRRLVQHGRERASPSPVRRRGSRRVVVSVHVVEAVAPRRRSVQRILAYIRRAVCQYLPQRNAVSLERGAARRARRGVRAPGRLPQRRGVQECGRRRPASPRRHRAPTPLLLRRVPRPEAHQAPDRHRLGVEGVVQAGGFGGRVGARVRRRSTGRPRRGAGAARHGGR